MSRTGYATTAQRRQPNDFPDLPHDLDQLLPFAVQFATLAPSSHNTQPWTFVIDGDTITVRADRSRRLPVVDPDDRELIISVGAALFGLRLALSAAGHDIAVDYSPTSDPDIVARVTLQLTEHDPDPTFRQLFNAATLRHTYRRPFHPRPVPTGTIDRLRDAVGVEGATLIPVEAEGREAIAQLVANGDRQQMRERAFRAELAAWLRPNRSVATDGMLGYEFGWNRVMSRVAPLVLRSMDIGKSQAARDRDLVTKAPLVAVVTSTQDAPPAWLAAGQALYRALLIATADGLSASFMNQPIEVATLRSRLMEQLATNEYPQVMLRFGFGAQVPAQPRRPLNDVLRRGEPGRG